MIDRIKELARRFHKDTVDIRRYLHEFPGLSFEEYSAIQVIHNFLTSWNIEHEPMTPTGIVAIIKGKNPEKKTVALRADTDALPIQEKNKCPYKSSAPGVMHACGHDAHFQRE